VSLFCAKFFFLEFGKFSDIIKMPMQKAQDNIFLIFKEIATEKGESPALFFKKNDKYQCLSYKNLYEKAITLGNFLLKKDINPQDKVAIFLENNYFWPISFMGIMYIKATSLPLNFQATEEELNYLIFHSQAKLLLTTSNLYSKAKEITKNTDCRILVLEDNFFQELTDTQLKVDFSDARKDDIACLVYTSGTTRTPKGVMLTHRNLLSNMHSLLKLNILKPTDCFISVLPLYHSYPFLTNLLLPLLSGAKISYPPQIEAEAILECIQKTGVTIFVGVPRLFSLFHEKILSQLKKHPFWFLLNPLLNIFLPLRKETINLAKILLSPLHKKFGKVRLFISGGAKLDIKVAKDFYKWGFTLLEGYGLTEASPVVSFNLPHKFKFGSAGIPIPDVEIKIENPDEKGEGEILVRGENIMRGYYKEEGLTLNTIKEGWLYTKDIGFIDKDGYLFIQARLTETITLSSGKKIHPEEIESSYLKSPYIKEICVFLSKKPEEKLCAVVFPDYEYFREQRITQIKEKIRWEIENLSKRLPPYKRIHQYVITAESLPKTTLGKLQRFKIEEKFYLLEKPQKETKKISSQDEELLSFPICRKAMEYISQELKREVNLDDHLELDLELDSLEQVGLLLGFQKELGVKLKEEDLVGVFTVRDILEKLKNFVYTKKEISLKWNDILKEPCEEKIKNSVTLSFSLSQKITNLFLYLILKSITYAFFSLRVKNKKNLPKSGPFILSSNHTSYLDGLIIASSLPFPLLLNTYFLGYRIYFHHPLIKWVNKLLRLIPLDTASNLIDALKVCSYILKNSKILCIFPEGKRSPTGEIDEFKKGAGILAKELNIPIVPLYIKGTYQAWPSYKRVPHPAKVTLVIGKPLTLEDLVKKINPYLDLYKNIVDNLREEILNLKNQL